MKGFSVHNGDVVVAKTIEISEGSELLRQKAELVVGTNKGEWSYDMEEGIDFFAVLRKNPDEDEIRATIEEALAKLDETLTVTDFSMELRGREAHIHFVAVTGNGEEVRGEYTYVG